MSNLADFIPAFECNIDMPNGLQWFNNDLFVIDQKTDNVFILDNKGAIKKQRDFSGTLFLIKYI